MVHQSYRLGVRCERAKKIRENAMSLMRRICRPLVYLWVLPTSSLGLLALVVACTRGRVQTRVVAGVLEIHGGWIAHLLRDYTLLPGGASAMTLGHVVLGRSQRLLDQTRDHERVHVRQCERWGPLFIPAYLGASLIVWLRGGRPYDDNPFEREAYSEAR
jgi:hypothetical protein